MPTPEKHALLSASSAARWLTCTAAPRFEERFPETTSEYAEEGRLAHAICELKVQKKFAGLSARAYTLRLNKLKKSELYNAEMDKTSEVYLDVLSEMAMASYNNPPHVAAEVQVRFDEWVPDGFGTCDCIMIGGGTLSITDYKHGKGVPVSAEGNPQMRLYALGALTHYRAVYGSQIKQVQMTIVQPRLRAEASTERITVEELLAWGESIKPIAQKAYYGLGTFCPGEHCRFCRGRAQCRARAEANTSLEPYQDVTDSLTDDEIGDLLIRGRGLVSWYKALEEHARGRLLSGGHIPGWKIVADRSNRVFSDPDAAITAAIKAGYDESAVYDCKPKSLAELEKLMGPVEFSKILGAYVVKPQGKPTLVPITDKREPYNPAAIDFAEIVKPQT